MLDTTLLRTYPGQIIGFRPARQHERPGRMYPIFAMGGASPDGDGADGAGDGQQGGQSDGADGGSSGSQSGNDGASSGQQGGQSDGQNGDKSGQQNGAGKVEDLPDWAQKLIKDAREDAGKARTTAKQTAAEEARNQLAQQIGKALGLVKDDEKPDPEKLTQQLTAAQAAQRQATVELAVFRNASKHQGDPAALLDSRSFLAKVADLDPTASDFETKVSNAIKDAVETNTKLKAGQAPGRSTVDHMPPGGGQRSGKPKSIAEAVSGHYGT